MQSEASIRAAAAELDEALEAADVDRVVACFAPDCAIELLGVRLEGHDGVRRWLAWVFGHVDGIGFTPRVVTVDGDTFIEEFGPARTSETTFAKQSWSRSASIKRAGCRWATSPRPGSAETVAIAGGPGRDRTSDRAIMSDRTPIPAGVG